jgi:hypothetical protein
MLQMIPMRGKASDTAKLVFRQDGDRYFLAQAWTSGEQDGLAVPKSQTERSVARELAGIKPQAKAIAFAASH